MKNILYVNFIVSTFCKLSCPYCELSDDERTETDFLSVQQMKFILTQLRMFFKKHNYDDFVISVTGDELHELPNALQYLIDVKDMLKEIIIGVDNVRVKMHTNANAPISFYEEFIPVLNEINTFAEMEYEVVYQSMYHSARKEQTLLYLQEHIKDMIVSVGLLDPSHEDKIAHLTYDFKYDFSEEFNYEPLEDTNVNYIEVLKTGEITNGCGFDMPSHLLLMKHQNFCKNCPNPSCEMLNQNNRL